MNTVALNFFPPAQFGSIAEVVLQVFEAWKGHCIDCSGFTINLPFYSLPGNFLSNAVKFTPAGGKLELDLQCEEVVDSKDAAPAPNFTAYTPSDSVEGSLLGATGIQILTKSTSHAKLANQKVARLRLSVKDNGIGKCAVFQGPRRANNSNHC